jgi:plasmid stabilization system protein ParE
VKKKKVIWSERATASLKEHYDHIKKDSVRAAKRYKSEIINASKGLDTYPEKYQLDEYYLHNPGNIRRFFRWSYRIVYQINDKTIDILNVLHSSQEPHQE